LRVTADARLQDGVGSSRPWTGTVCCEARRFAPLGATARVRGSLYSGDPIESRLLLGMLGFDPLAAAHLELGAGRRWSHDEVAALDDQEDWWNALLDLSLGHRIYLNGSYEHESGPAGPIRQIYAGAALSF
jgi:hypothetical protein